MSLYTKIAYAGSCVLVGLGSAHMAHSETLSFDKLAGVTNGTTIIGDHDVLVSSTAKFTNAANDNGRILDVVIEASVKTATDFGTPGDTGGFGDAGFIPRYRPATTNTDTDLAFLYYGNDLNDTENGVTFTFSFYDGDAAMAGTFSNAVKITELKLAVYDVDGESVAKGNFSDQSEYFNAYPSDGLVSYALGNTPQALTATQSASGITFRGSDKNFSEADPSGAVILRYQDTSTFVLDFGSKQTGGAAKNAVFSAFDGDLSLFEQNDFNETLVSPSQVPLPASLVFMLAGISPFVALGFGRLTTKKG